MGMCVLCPDGWVTPRSYTSGVSLVESAEAPRHRHVHFATPCMWICDEVAVLGLQRFVWSRVRCNGADTMAKAV